MVNMKDEVSASMGGDLRRDTFAYTTTRTSIIPG